MKTKWANGCTPSIAWWKAAGSTPIGASRSMPVLGFGFGKAHLESTPFVSNLWLILVESS
jgi:hypothetical protein